MELDLDRTRLFMRKTQVFQSISSPSRSSQHYFVLHISHSRPIGHNIKTTDRWRGWHWLWIFQWKTWVLLIAQMFVNPENQPQHDSSCGRHSHANSTLLTEIFRACHMRLSWLRIWGILSLRAVLGALWRSSVCSWAAHNCVIGWCVCAMCWSASVFREKGLYQLTSTLRTVHVIENRGRPIFDILTYLVSADTSWAQLRK